MSYPQQLQEPREAQRRITITYADGHPPMLTASSKQFLALRLTAFRVLHRIWSSSGKVGFAAGPVAATRIATVRSREYSGHHDRTEVDWDPKPATRAARPRGCFTTAKDRRRKLSK